MDHISRSTWSENSSVQSALEAAGWHPGRQFDVSVWLAMLASAGFTIEDWSLQIWKEFGGLRIVSSMDRSPSSSLLIDPVDACIDSFDESIRLRDQLGTNFSPLGMWSAQFRSYMGSDGRVIAVGPKVVWVLGENFSEALDYVVNGGGGSRAIEVDWL